MTVAYSSSVITLFLMTYFFGGDEVFLIIGIMAAGFFWAIRSIEKLDQNKS